MLKVYAYNKNTKEYTGIEYAQENPKRKGDYIMPANTTAVQVGEYEKGYIPVFNGNDWELIKDFRGKYQINLIDLNISKVSALGEITKGYQLLDDKTYYDFLNNPLGFNVIDGVFTDIRDTAEYKNNLKKEEILNKLKKIDEDTVRPLRAKIADTATKEDENKLLFLEEQADILRQELNKLGGT